MKRYVRPQARLGRRPVLHLPLTSSLLPPLLLPFPRPGQPPLLLSLALQAQGLEEEASLPSVQVSPQVEVEAASLLQVEVEPVSPLQVVRSVLLVLVLPLVGETVAHFPLLLEHRLGRSLAVPPLQEYV